MAGLQQVVDEVVHALLPRRQGDALRLLEAAGLLDLLDGRPRRGPAVELGEAIESGQRGRDGRFAILAPRGCRPAGQDARARDAL